MVQMVRDYGNQLNWNVGGLFVHDRFIHILIDTLDKLGYTNPIKSVYGTVPCIMAGGIAPRFDFPDSKIIDIIDEYNNRGVSCNVDFSNVFVEEKDFDNERCNKILEHLDSNNIEGFGSNKVIVSDPRYAEYVRNNFGEVGIIASYMKPMFEIGLGNDNVKYYNKLFDTFDYIIVNPYKVNDLEFLNSLDNKDKVYFEANSIELPNDPLTQKFYSINMIYSLKLLMDDEDCSEELKKMEEISNLQGKTKKEYPMAGTNLSQSDIENLLRLGFRNFSLQGLDGDISTFIRDLGEYMFVPHLFNRVAGAIMYSLTLKD